ncbi:hypothetical protein QBC41DRAFT_112207 [Cercophora samala]|uniref:Heterokaryon incompatibility domain-containing protein n=1 Tax=Cercophora samala TaxID=330535 RepID=A0AA39ZEB9_9PEZI|nr:hypothetical protein QBC41DRAFT_112207 [Cercophora samala]
MRLVNTRSKRLERLYSDPTEPYATLSHTWGREEDELSFQDMQALDKCDVGRRAKLDRSCEQACKDGINYIWIDTCCIDKTSTVELSEAINSMFRWYQNSTVCYAYLSDVTTGGQDEIRESRWFTRGWTLQELLAPRKVTFFNSTWAELGTKSTLRVIETTTGIPHHILTGIANLQTCSVAQRMSWASKRTTTRPEDLAYCLLGIFDVMITPIYGEGLQRAFGRLQEAIMKQIADDSILAWSLDITKGREARLERALSALPGSVLASSPADFEHCGDIIPRPPSLSGLETHIRAFDIFGGTMPITICLSDPLVSRTSGPRRRHGSELDPSEHPSRHLVYGYLTCGLEGRPSFLTAIPLVSCHDETSKTGGKEVYNRPHGLHTISIPKPRYIAPAKAIWIRNDRPGDLVPSHDKSYWIYLPPKQYPWNAVLDEVYPPSCFERDMAMIKTPRPHEFAAYGDTDETLLLARFSYTLETAGSFILVLRFFRESVTGKKEPWPYLYFDDQYSPTPLSSISKLWKSLLFTSTHEIIPAQEPLFGLAASVTKQTIDRHCLWVMDLSSVPANDPTGDFHRPDWPNISDQITLRNECYTLVQRVFEGEKLLHQYRLKTGDIMKCDAEMDGTVAELERVSSEIAALKVRAESIQYRLDRQAAYRSSLRGLTQTLSLNMETMCAAIVEAEDSEYVKRVWPRTAKSDKNSRVSVTEMIKGVEHDGVMAHILDRDPARLGDKLGGETPRSLGSTKELTLLMYAAATGNPEMVYRVLRYDSDTVARDSTGSTAKDWAERSGLHGFETICADWKRGDLEAIEKTIVAFRQQSSKLKRRSSFSVVPIPAYNSSRSIPLPAPGSSPPSPTSSSKLDVSTVSQQPLPSGPWLPPTESLFNNCSARSSASREGSRGSGPAVELGEQNRKPRRSN